MAEIVFINRLHDESGLRGIADYIRKDGWEKGQAKVLNNAGDVFSLRSRTATFRYIKNNSEEVLFREYIIIIGANNKVLWVGDIEAENKETERFISYGEKVYRTGYDHKYLRLFPNISMDNDYFDDKNNENNDGIIKKYKENIGRYRFAEIEDAKRIIGEEKMGVFISLEGHFEKRFFYKGPKWNTGMRDHFTMLKNITVKNGLFCIEIENKTYPHCGYVLLDLGGLKITH